MKRFLTSIAAFAGTVAMLGGLGATKAARADAEYDRRLAAVHHDKDNITRNMRAVMDLQSKERDQRRAHDRKHVMQTEAHIARVRRDLRRDRQLLARDKRALKSYGR